MAKILVAEDEPLVRMLIVETLSDAGYELCEACDGEAALSVVAANEDLSLIVSDVRMPKIDGYELALAARRLRPNIPLLFTTGYGKATIPAELAGVRTLHKPFDTDELEAVVRALLATPP